MICILYTNIYSTTPESNRYRVFSFDSFIPASTTRRALRPRAASVLRSVLPASVRASPPALTARGAQAAKGHISLGGRRGPGV